MAQSAGSHRLEAGGEEDRGREADKPSEITKRGWRDILMRLRVDIKDDNVSIVAAGVAFYSMLALFPALVAIVSIYGLFTSPQEVTSQVQQLTDVLPKDAAKIIGDQLKSVASAPKSGVGVGAIVSILAAIWSASAGMNALITGVNIAYDERETRGFVKLRGLALMLTVGAMVFFILVLAALAVFPALAANLPGGDLLVTVISIARWPLLLVLIVAGLAVIFRVAPNRDSPSLRWLSTGAVVATVFWLLASIGFAFYANNFSNYNKTYGSLGAIIVLLMWLYISAFVILIGAELNGQMEMQTRKDTTTGPDKPLGERDAEAADTVASAPEGKKKG